MQLQSLPMEDFMGRFGRTLFGRAQENLDPEYLPGSRPDLESRLLSLDLLRYPFPDQQEAIFAAYQHLYDLDEKMVFPSAEMGTGKTLLSMMIPNLHPRLQRCIVVCPPHLVQKWAREIRDTIPDAVVKTINHSGANQVLVRDAKECPGAPERLTFYIIGRVRLRMSFARKPVFLRFRNQRGLRCPDCYQPLLVKLSKQEAKKAIENGDTFSLYQAAGTLDGTTSENDEDMEDLSSDYYQHISVDQISKPRHQVCHHVLQDGVVVTGCGSPLWQATRLHPKSRAEILRKGICELPGVGDKMADQIIGLPSFQNLLRDLENGSMHPDLVRLLGPKTKKRVQEYLDEHGFTLAEGDYAPVDTIQRRLPKGWFDVAILDELHELKGDDSLVGAAFGRLAGAVKKVIGLTGTLVDGYAQSLHPLFFRANPARMLQLGYDAHAAARFQREMGVVKQVVTEVVDGSTITGRGVKVVRRQTRNLPGLHPSVITHILLPNSIFLKLEDVERGLQRLAKEKNQEINLLPSYREVFVPLAMDPLQGELVKKSTMDLARKLKDYLRDRMHFVLAPIVTGMLYYPDGGFQDYEVVSSRLDEPLAHLPAFGDGPLPKERFFVDLALREHAQGRKLLLYTTYTDRLDLTGRYQKFLTDAGLRAKVLKSNVPTDSREQWVKDALQKGIDVLICNPELVKTGLDLFEFETICFVQTGYRTDTVQQASRRSWRIGQTRPVRVYYLGYDESPQMRALSLIAKKMMVSNQAQGSIAKIGLSDAVEDDDDSSSMLAMANAILDEVRDKSRDAITGSIRSLAEDDLSAEFTASSMSVLQGLLHRPARQQTVPPVVTPPPPVRPRPAAKPVAPEPTGDFMDDFLSDFLVESREESPKPTAKRTQRKAKTSNGEQFSLF